MVRREEPISLLDPHSRRPAWVGIRLSPPAPMPHKMIPRPELEAAGISDGFNRLSGGIEDSRDLTADLDQALRKGSARR